MFNTNRTAYLNLAALLAVGPILSATDTGSQNHLNINPIRKIYAQLGLESTGSLEELRNIGKEEFLNKSGELKNDEYSNNRARIMALLDDAGMVNEIKPTNANPKYVIIMGASVPLMQKRVAYAAEFMQQYTHPTTMQKIKKNIRGGVRKVGARLGICEKARMPKVIALVGSRKLDPKETQRFGDTEAQAIRGLIAESTLHNYPVEVIESSALFKGSPATDDVIKTWLNTLPEPGVCLIVSSQPQIHRQAMAFEVLAPKGQGFVFEGVGPKVDSSIAVYLDEVVHTLDQHVKYFAECPELANHDERVGFACQPCKQS